jgi:hypothetical protein
MKASLIRALLFTGLLLTRCDLGEAQAQEAHAVASSQSTTDEKAVEVTTVTLSASQAHGQKKSYSEVNEFRETKELHLVPADKFVVDCDFVGKAGLSAEDFVVWTTIDFLVAPATRKYEEMDINQLGTSVSWGQVTEMRDLRATEIHSLRPGQTVHLSMSEFDLRPVMAAFPLGDAGNLWPWLMRVNIHVQGRDGNHIAQAERTVRLWPDSARITN